MQRIQPRRPENGPADLSGHRFERRCSMYMEGKQDYDYQTG